MKTTNHALTAWLVSAALAALAPAALAAEEHHDAAHAWTYSGDSGPTHWGDMNAEFATCTLGQHQSPIDIRGAAKADLPPIQFDYRDAPLKIVNNGHTIMITVAPGSSITVGGKRFDLVQFHFHHPSEEKVDGKQFDMVAHLVHKDAEGHLAVVGVLLKAGGADNALLEQLWDHLPAKVGGENTVASESVNAKSLLPAQSGYYTFDGSLTTPPCSEGVTWFVMKQPLGVSAKDVERFAAVYPDNARPVQPVNGRPLRETK
jgi:carbonic anhydrase